MSTAVISYSSMKDASLEARQVARKLTNYADHLNSGIYRKLNNYHGSYTGNIAEARGRVNAKICELRNKSAAYTNYANDLSDLKEKCQSTDRAVRSMVSQLTANFKSAHGIKNSRVQNTINYFLAGTANATVAGRWLGHASDKAESVKDYIKQSLKDWWDYEGGKALIKGGAVAVLEIVGGVCTIFAGVAAMLAAGAVFAFVAALAGTVLGVIGFMNGMANLKNEKRAYQATHNNGNPALGARLSSEDTLQDTVRRETDSKFWHNFAKGMDVVTVVCTAINFLDGTGKLVKNAYKWTTGSMAKVENLRVRDILTKENISGFKNKVKMRFGEIKKAVTLKDIAKVKEFGLNFKDDFFNNLREFKEGYTDFSSIKKGSKSIKSWSSALKTMVSGDFSKETIKNFGWNEIILPNLKFAHSVTYDPKPGNNGGIFDYKNSGISLENLSKLKEDPSKLFQSVADLFQSDNVIDKNVLNGLRT